MNRIVSILVVFLMFFALRETSAATVVDDGMSRPKPEYHQPAVAARRMMLSAAPLSGTESSYSGSSDVYYAQNNRMRLYFHTRYSDEWYFSWNGNEAETSFRENFALWFDGRTSYGACTLADEGDATTVKFFGNGRNDEDNSCILDFRNALRVERSIRIAPGDGTYFKVCYKVTNITDSPIADVRFFELVDFDIPNTGGCGNDIGWYDALTDFVWVKDEAWFQNGFTGNRPSSHHSVHEYYDVINLDAADGILNDYNEFDFDDPGIGLQWDAGTLQPGETWDLDVTFWFGQPNSLFAVAGPDRVVRAGETVRFDGGTSYADQGTITAYDWDLDGDGDYGDATGVAVDHVFPTHGTKSVVLRVTDDRGECAYDECKVTVLPAMYRDVAVTARIPLAGLSPDLDSATAPHSVSKEGGSLLLTWQAGLMNLGMRKSFSYVVDVLDPLPGERRMVEEECLVEYLDATVDGEAVPVASALGPAYVDVASDFGIAVSSDKDGYLPPETARLTTSVEVPACTDAREFAGRERLLDAALSGVDADAVPGAAVVAADAGMAELSFIVETPLSAVWRDIRFDASCPEGAAVEVRTRSAATLRGLEAAAFSGPSPSSGSAVDSPPGRFLEARVVLRPNAAGASPEFRSLCVAFATDGHRAVVRLVSPEGRTLDVASHDIFASDCGETVVFTDPWPTAGAASGNWRAVAELHGPDAEAGVLASASDDFAVLAEGLETIVSSSLSADRPRYCRGDTAVLSAAVSNGSLRDAVSELDATLTVTAPDGTVVLRENYRTGGIPASSADRRTFRLAVAPGMPQGAYAAVLSVRAGGSPVASSSASFLVVAEAEEGRGMSGTLRADPQRVLRRSGTLALNGSATNTGASALQAVGLVMRVHSKDGEYVSGERRENAALQAGETLALPVWTLSGITLDPGVYPVSLTAELTAPSGRAVEIPLDSTGFEVVNLAPEAVIGGQLEAEATSADSNPVTLSAAASTDANSTDPDGRNDIASYAWTVDGIPAGTGAERTFGLALGSHEVVLTVTDTCGAAGTAEAVVHVRDLAPPAFTGMTPDGAEPLASAAQTVSVTVKDGQSGVDPESLVLTLDGNAVQAAFDSATGLLSFQATELSGGVHTVRAQAADLAGNASETTWSFSVSLPAPASDYLLFHNSRNGRLDITGGGKTIAGMVHSHADIRVQGNGTAISGSASAVGGITVHGNGHDIALRQEHASPVPMPEYSFADYEARADHVVNGRLTAGGKKTLSPGIWIVYGDVKITGDLDAAVTIAATGTISVRGKTVRISSADAGHHLALFSRDGDITFAANGSRVAGIVYAPSGECRVSSNGSAFAGGIIGDTIDISGQDIAIGPLEP